MLSFSNAQIDGLRDSRIAAFAVEMAADLRAFAPRHAAALGEAGLGRAVMFGLDRARVAGVDRRGPARLWLQTSVILGGFWDESPLFTPLFGAIGAAMATDQMAASARVYAALED